MKKFQFAAGLFALAMLGACSNEIPEVPGTVEEGNTDSMYIAISLASDGTRVDENAIANENEDYVENVQLILIKDNEEFLNVTATQVTGKLAKFAINATTYQVLQDLTEPKKEGENPATFDIYVYVNGSELDAFDGSESGKNYLKDGKTDNLRKESTNVQTGGKPFIMSNSEKVTGSLSKFSTLETKPDGTLSNPWQIASNVKVTRLAARFDYVEGGTNNSYTATSDNNLVMHVAGMGVRTFATSTYRLPHFSGDGTDSDMILFGDATKFFPVTDAYGWSSAEATGRLKLNALTYQIRPTGYTTENYNKTYTYERPNTLTQTQTASFLNTPFVAIRAEFTADWCSATTAAVTEWFNDQDNNETPHLYALNGILIGGIRELKALKTKGETFKVTHNFTEGTDEYKIIKDVEDAVASILVRFDLDDQDNLDSQITAIKGQVYSPSTQTGKFYTYYAQYIRTYTDDELTSKGWGEKKCDALRYGVLRNHIYKLKVNSFGWLGNNGDYYPGQNPEDADIEKKAISLTLEVDDWKLVPVANNTWNL